MDILQQTQHLREQLRQWADSPEWGLLVRYELLPQKPPPQWQQRLLQRAGRLLRVMGLNYSRYRKQPWQAGLKHAPRPEGELQAGARVLLLWAEGLERQEIRKACAGMQSHLHSHPALIPVLITDVADFAFYSRLHWLVEYLPRPAGEDSVAYERKRRYLAWRYRAALALPLAAGLLEQNKFDALLAI